MKRSSYSFPLFLLVVFFLASAPAVFGQHWPPPILAGNMSVLIDDATLDGETLVEGDEIGIFTPEGLMAGATAITDEGFPVGPAAWGDDQDEQGINGFRNGEALSFKVWDHAADQEWDAEPEVEMGELVYERDAFVIITLAAIREEIPGIQVAENAHNFGAVRVGREATWDFQIESVGNAPMTVESITLSDAESFMTNFGDAVEIANGESFGVTVTFAPNGTGDFASEMTINSDAQDNGSLVIQLTGVGEEALPADIALSAADRSFGRIIVGQTRNLPLYIFNEGDLPLTVSDIATGNEVFTTDFNGEFEIAAGDRHELTVTFAPAEAAVYESELTITSNDPDEGNVAVPLFGQGRAPGEVAMVDLLADEHFYGAVGIGNSIAWRLVVTNAGGSDLMVSDVTSDNDAFVVEFEGDPVRLRPGDYLFVNTAFAPGAEMFYEGMLTVTSDDEENGEISIPVAGSGLVANNNHFRAHNTGSSNSILVTSATLDGNALGVGDEVAIVTTSGLIAGAGAIDARGEAGIAAFGDDESTDIIDGFLADEAFAFLVWDAATGTEAWGNANYEEGPEVYTDFGITVLSIDAAVGDPMSDIALSENIHFYGQVPTDEGEDWVLTISNQGRGSLTVSNIEADLNEFTTDFDGEFDLALGESRDITVNFLPSEINTEYDGRLTIMSNDPVDSVLYVDLNGHGVDVRREPEISIVPNYFFGAIQINAVAEYTLHINNIGGGLMTITDIALQGSNYFTSDWDGRQEVAAGGMYDLTITYNPAQVRTHQANVIITSDDPNNGQISFLVEGDAVNEASHFHHRVTNLDHSILIEQALMNMPGDRQSPLAPGDEIALLTESGLCAGHIVVEEQGAPIGIAAWGDDQGTDVIDGFVDGEEFTYMVWDRSTHQELVGEPTYEEGPQTFQGQSQTILTQLVVFNDVVEAQIVVEPMVYNYGAVHANQAASHVFTISNAGGVDLTITRIASNMGIFTHDFNNQATVLGAGESIEVNVTFRPTEYGAFEGQLTVFSDDPDQDQFIFRPCGVGSVQIGHFDFLETDQNHSILFDPFTMGDVNASIGDQIGAFTEDGYCAGGGTVDSPGSCGVAVFRDDPDTRYVIEGMQAGERIHIKVWDASQRREYTEDQIEMEIEGGEQLAFEGDGLDFGSINVPGVVVLSPNPAEFDVRENDEISAHFTIANAPGDMDLTFIDRDSIAQNGGEVEFVDNGDNTADFTWHISFDAFRNRPYVLRFQASNGNVTDITSIVVTITNENRAPIVANPFQNDIVTFNEDPQLAGDPPTLTVVPNLNVLFNDPDGNQMSFVPISINPAMFHRTIAVGNVQVYQMTPTANYFGDVVVVLRANDGQRAPGRDLRRAGGSSITDAEISDPSATPNRDATTDYRFTIHFNSVNDLPVITVPQNNGAFVWNIPENQDAAQQFVATDVESRGAELVWTMPDRGGLPDEAVFRDNRDGTAQLTWHPTAEDIGQYQTVVRVTDADNGVDEIRNFTINVNNVNDPPEPNDQNPIPDVEILEDAERTVIATLNDNHWTDIDGDQLFYGVVAPAPADLQVVYDANSTEVSIMPRLNINGEYEVIVFCRDRAQGGNELRHTINVTVLPINDAPTFVPPNINDVNIVEDANMNELQIARLNLKFRDVDAGDHLVFTVDGPAELNLRIDANTTALFRRLTAHYNTAAIEGGRAAITVTATDDSAATESTTFFITVTPDVNDLPAAFNLLRPENNHFFRGSDEELRQPIVFEWEEAVQNQWEIDSIRYFVWAVPNGSQDTFRVVTPGDEVRYEIPVDSVLRRLPRGQVLEVTWNVRALDRAAQAGLRFSIPSTNGAFRFRADTLEIRELDGASMPESYFISNSYPNPFNARTTLQFGLPTPGDVEVSVWDMHGRKVASLAGGYHQAGQYELTWTAEGMTSGIYLIKMQSGAFIGMQKAILVR